MKRISIILLLSAFLGAFSLADVTIPAGSTQYITSSGSDNITINQGGILYLQVNSGNIGASVANSGAFCDYSAGTTFIGASISGSGAYFKGGTSATVFTGSNTYRGVTVIDSGVLQTGTSNTLSKNSAVFIAGSGTLDLNNFQQSVGSISGSGAILMGDNALPEGARLVNSGSSLTVGTNSGFSGSTYSGGVISTANNYYAGSTLTLGGGKISVIGGTGGILSGSASIFGSVTAGNTYDLGGGTLVLGNGGSSGGAVISTGAGGTLSFNPIINGNFSLSSGTVNIVIAATFSGTSNLPCLSGIITNRTSSALVLAGSISLAPGSSVSCSGSDGVLTFTSGSTILGSTLSGSTFTIWSAPVVTPLLAMRSFYAPEPTLTSTGNGVLITGNDNLNTIYSGTISGHGQVIKTGTGTWNFTGLNTSDGMTTVANGALLVNGTVSGDVYVWGGYLGGGGTIGGSVLNNSLVSPGNSPGVLTIAGDYSQTSNGYLLIQIQSTSVYDQLIVGGHAYLDGGLVIEGYDGFVLQIGQSYTFLSATAGISGSWSSIIGLNYLVDGIATSDGTNLTVTLVQGSFANEISGLTPNQKAVATALDSVVGNSRVAPLVETLDAMTKSQIKAALDRIAPTDLLPMFDAAIASADVQQNNIERRLEEVRAGAVGWSCAGLSLGNRPNPVGEGRTIKPDGKDATPASQPISDRWGFFVNGSGEFVDIDSSSDAHGTDFRTAGVSSGVDYRLGDHAVIGAMAGYANTTGNGYTDSAVRTDSGKLALYGSFYGEGLFVNAGLGGGLESYDTKRDTVGGQARGSTNGNEFNASIGTGYTYAARGWSFGPIGSLRYSTVGIDSFTEHGSLAPLHYGDQSENSLRSLLGGQVAYVIQTGTVAVKPQVRLQWSHEYFDTTRAIGAGFLPGGDFTVYGPETGADCLQLETGVTVQFSPFVAMNLFYETKLGRNAYDDQSVNGGFEIRF